MNRRRRGTRPGRTSLIWTRVARPRSGRVRPADFPGRTVPAAPGTLAGGMQRSSRAATPVATLSSRPMSLLRLVPSVPGLSSLDQARVILFAGRPQVPTKEIPAERKDQHGHADAGLEVLRHDQPPDEPLLLHDLVGDGHQRDGDSPPEHTTPPDERGPPHGAGALPASDCRRTSVRRRLSWQIA